MKHSITLLLLILIGCCTTQSDGKETSVQFTDELFHFLIEEENPMGGIETTSVQGVLHIGSDDTIIVSWLWLINGTTIQLLPVFESVPSDPYYQCVVANVGEQYRLIDIKSMHYDQEGGPIQGGLVMLQVTDPYLHEGWGGIGRMIGQEDEIDQALNPISNERKDCSPPPTGNGGQRYVIPINENEVIIIIISDNGTVTILIYRKDANGCWRFSITPDTYEPPPLPGFTGHETVLLVYIEYLLHMMEDSFSGAPPFPFP